MSTSPPVSLVCIGRFHHFHLARQLEKRSMLDAIWTGYPRFQLKTEEGIPASRIKTYPWLHGPYMSLGRLHIDLPDVILKEWQLRAQTLLDRHVSTRIRPGNTLIALSGGGLSTGKTVKKNGGTYICDRGSSHIRFQDQILREEYTKWGVRYTGIDPRMIAREEAEYEQADFISVPSQFVADSFEKMGLPCQKLFINPYGARLERFSPVAEPDSETFTLIFVGQVSVRKGFLYLLQALEKLKVRNKKLKVIGTVAEDVKPLLSRFNLDCVEFLGRIPNADLPRHYSTAHAMVLPSIEEGLAMVIGEALACGCPVIASENTGARDFYSDAKEGFIVPIRDAEALAARMTELAESPQLRRKMSTAALTRVKEIGGWDAYGTRWERLLKSSSSTANTAL